MNDEIDEIVRLIHEQIRFHREQYELAVKPLVERLAQIEAMRPPRAFFIPADSWRSL
jgi:hypothetical protein